MVTQAIAGAAFRRRRKPVIPPPLEAPIVKPEEPTLEPSIDLPAGWQVKQVQGGIHYITPDNWEILPHPDDPNIEPIYVSPQGNRYQESELVPGRYRPQFLEEEGLAQVQFETQEELLASFGRVFPGIDAPTLFESMAVTPDMPLGSIESAEQAQDDFIDTIWARGRSPDTEAVLRQIGFTDEQFDEFFARIPTFEKREAKFWAERYAGMGLSGKAVNQFIAGVGDLFSTSSGVAIRYGYDDAGASLSELGSGLQRFAPPGAGHDFEFADVLNPTFYAEQVTRTLPFALALAPLAIGGFYAGAGIAAASGIGTIGSMIIGGFSGAALSRPLESALEAGGQYNDAIARGKTEQEAQEEYDQVFRDNMLLIGADAFEIAIALAPTPKWVPLALVRGGLVRTATIAGKMVIIGLSEGGEEIYQDMISRRARGEEWQWDPISKEVFAIGAVMGAGMGLGGDVVQSVVNRSKDTMTPDMRKNFNNLVDSFKAEGFTTQQSELRALDEAAQTPEGQARVAEAIEEIKKEIPEKPPVAEVPEAILPLDEISKYETRIPLDLIRKDEKVTLERLTEEIKRKGITEPITIRVREDGSRIVWDGIHRLIVAQDLGIRNVPVKFIGEVAKPLAPIPTNPEVVGKSIAEQTGLRFDGVQEGIGLQFTDTAQTGTTFNANTLEEAQAKLVEKRELFAQPTPQVAPEAVRPPAEAVKPEIAPTPPVAKIKPVEAVTERTVVKEGGVPTSPDEPIARDVADNIPVIQDIGAKERIRPARKVFEKMGLYEEYKGIQRAEVELGEAREVYRKKLAEMSKLVDKNRRSLVFRELENPGSQVGLTFNEKRVVGFFRDSFNKWADKLNLPQEKRVKNYVTHIFEADITEQLKAKHPLDNAMAKALEYRTPKTIFNPFLQKRLGATVGLVEDPFAAGSAYESRQLKVLYYEPFLQKLASIANDVNTPRTVRDYLKDYSRRMTGEPAKIDIEINKSLQEFAEIVRKLPGGEGLANALSRGNPAGMASYNFTSMLYTLWLGFKATSAIRNLSQHTLIISEVGPAHFANGIKLRFTKEGKAALDESLAWRSRRGAFVPGIDDSFASRWTDRFRETALAMFRGADAQNVKDAFLAGYSEAKNLLPDADRQVWIDRGDEVAADTQYLYTKMNSMSLSQNAIGRVFSVLTTWSVNWLELMNKWVSRRPSQVYLQYEKITGTKLPKKNWSRTRKAIILYMVIVGLGYLIKERTRVKAWEYTGITSIRYLAGVAGGDFPGLQAPGAIAGMIAGFLTDDERMLKTGWNEAKSTFTPGIVRQIENVAAGEKDWLTLLFYLEGQDFYINRLQDKWQKGWKEYEAITVSKERNEYRENNPLIEAQMFVTSRFTTLSTEKARQEVLRIIEENNLDTELIKGYEKVFGVDTDEELAAVRKTLGKVELDEEGNQKVKDNGELDYFTTANFASEVNKLEKVVGRYKIEKDGNALAIEYLRAKDLFIQYDSLTEDDARTLYRQQFPDVEASLYLWGRVGSFKNPKSADLLLGLMDKYNIPPEAVPAFLDNPEKYDNLSTQKFELQKKGFDLDTEYENYGNTESPLFIKDEKLRQEAREKLKEDNPTWVADLRRIEAIDHDATDKLTEGWAERGKVVDEFGSSSSEVKVWLIDRPEVHRWALEQGLLSDDGSDWNETVLRINVRLATLTEGSVEYNLLKRKREAHMDDFPENLIDTYVDWFETERGGYEDDWFLMDNPEFHQALVDTGIWKEQRDFSKVPTREVNKLYIVYQELPLGQARLDYRAKHPMLEAWFVSALGYKPLGNRGDEKADISRPDQLSIDIAETLERLEKLQ